MAAETIGLIASVATLSKIAKIVVEISRLLQDAPDEARRVSDELIQLSLHSCLVGELRARCQSANEVGNPVLRATNQSLAEIEKRLHDIADDLQGLVPKPSKRSILKWTMLRRNDTKRLLRDLISVRTSLMTTLSLAICLDVPASLHFETKSSQLVHEHKPGPTNKSLISQETDIEKQDVEPTTTTTTMCDWSRGCSTHTQYWTLSLPWLARCATGLTWEFKRPHYTTIGASVLVKLPFSYAATVRVVARSYDTGRIPFNFVQGTTFSLSNLVPQDCEFFLACSRGDGEKMRDMLAKRLASPTDVDELGTTPMALAVMSGKTHAVKVLLDHGVDVNACFRRNQLTPLAWALKLRHLEIVRLLLSNDASCYCFSGYGWSPLFYLWPCRDKTQPVGDFIDVLQDKPLFTESHRDVVDTAGYSLLHRAAIFAAPSDVVRLIKLGADRHTTEGQLKWTAIYHAVAYNRLETFEALRPYFPYHHIDDADTRGWTLLHISASEGHDAITRRLLQLGADWRALSTPGYSEMPEELYGGRWTPAEVALAQGGAEDGQRRKGLFLQAVRDVLGVDVSLVVVEDDRVEENWVDAPEEICV